MHRRMKIFLVIVSGVAIGVTISLIGPTLGLNAWARGLASMGLFVAACQAIMRRSRRETTSVVSVKSGARPG